MNLRLVRRMLTEPDPRLVRTFVTNFGFGGLRSVLAHRRRLKRGKVFPPFLYVSIINSCNLRCQGCWVDVAHERSTIDIDAMNRLIAEAKAMGNRFFGLVGGEPFMHPQIFDILEQNRDCYFQIFTNGQFITDKVAARLREVGNATPLISVEGTEIISDERRGRRGVLSKTLKGIENAVANRLITGVCTSVCRTNIDDLVTDTWVDRLVEMGVMYTWFHVYRPMGPEPNFDLALTRDQQRRIRQFVVDARATKPIGVVDAYHDADGKALCPAATGLTHHVNPWGGVEPCPIIQFATESIHDKETRTGAEDLRPLREKVMNSPFLDDFRKLARETTRGCIVLERPDLLKKLTEKHTARDETARRTAAAELDAMTPRTSQYHPGDEIPERSWVYRLAKKFAFSDFGVYDGHDHSRTAAPFLENVDRPATPAEPDLVELNLN